MCESANARSLRVSSRQSSFNPSTFGGLITNWNNSCHDSYKVTSENEFQDFIGAVKVYYQSENEPNLKSCCIQTSNKDRVNDIILKMLQEAQINSRVFSNNLKLVELTQRGARVMDDHERPLFCQLKWLETEVEGRFLLVRYYSMSSMEKDIETQIQFAQGFIFRHATIQKKFYSQNPHSSDMVTQSRSTVLSNKLSELQALESMISDERVNLDISDKILAIKIFTSQVFPTLIYTTKLISIYDSTLKVINEVLKCHVVNDDEQVEYRMVAWIVKNDEFNKNPETPVCKYQLYSNDKPMEIYQQLTGKGYIVNFHLEKTPQILVNGTDLPGVSRVFDFGLLHHALFSLTHTYILLSTEESDNIDSPSDHPTCIYLKPGITVVGKKYNEIKKYYRNSCTPVHLLVLNESNIKNVHCCFHFTDNNLKLQVLSKNAQVSVDKNPVTESIFLDHGQTVCIGIKYKFMLVDGMSQKKQSSDISQDSDSSRLIRPRLKKPLEPIEQLSMRSISASSMKNSCRNGLNTMCVPTLPYSLKLSIDISNYLIDNILSSASSMLYDCAMNASALLYLLYIEVDERCSKMVSSKNGVEEMTYNLLDKFSRFKNNLNDLDLIFWLANFTELSNILKNDQFFVSFFHNSCSLIHDTSLQLCNYTWIRMESLVRIMSSCLYDVNTPVECSSLELQHLISSEMLWDKSSLQKINFNIFSESIVRMNQLSSRNPQIRINELISVFNTWLSCFCKCELNPLYIVQFFSKTFECMSKIVTHYILHQHVISRSNQGLEDSSHGFLIPLQTLGKYLMHRLNILTIWAENQGLETAISKDMLPVTQLIGFLVNQKENVPQLQEQCRKLSCFSRFEVLSLLQNYRSSEGMTLPQEWIQEVSYHLSCKSNVQSSGDNYQESSSNHLPFIVPNDINFADNLGKFFDSSFKTLQNYIEKGHCELLQSCENSKENWKCRCEKNSQNFLQKNVQDSCSSQNYTNCDSAQRTELVRLNIKRYGKSLGVNIVSVNLSNSQKNGIFVKNVMKNSVIDLDKRICVGDQLLSVNGQILTGLTQIQAAQLIMESGDDLCFEVLKKSASYYGFGHLFATDDSQSFNDCEDSEAPISNQSQIFTNQNSSNKYESKCAFDNTQSYQITGPNNSQKQSSDHQSTKNECYSNDEDDANTIMVDREAEYNYLIKRGKHQSPPCYSKSSAEVSPRQQSTKNSKYERQDSKQSIRDQQSPEAWKASYEKVKQPDGENSQNFEKFQQKSFKFDQTDQQNCQKPSKSRIVEEPSPTSVTKTITYDARYLFSKIKDELQSVREQRIASGDDECVKYTKFTKWSSGNSPDSLENTDSRQSTLSNPTNSYSRC